MGVVEKVPADSLSCGVLGVCRVELGRDDMGMVTTTRLQQRYHHRLRDLVRSTGNIGYAIRQAVPRFFPARPRPQAARTCPTCLAAPRGNLELSGIV